MEGREELVVILGRDIVLGCCWRNAIVTARFCGLDFFSLCDWCLKFKPLERWNHMFEQLLWH